VTYTAAATDIVDGTDPVTCTPASGSTFAIGTTAVNCTATDKNTGATLVLAGGLYQMLSLDVDQSATVVFHAAAEIRTKTELDADNKAKMMLDPAVTGLKASQVVIYVAGQNADGKHAAPDSDGDDGGAAVVNIGKQNVVQANICAVNGTVWIKSKTTATGAFIGEDVRIGQNVTLALSSAFVK
jgi:hypothetical protein